MAFDPVPWAVSGSQLDAYVMRALANIATRDAEGIQLPGDAKVTATTPSPSGSIVVSDGGLIIRNRQAAGQSYVGHIASNTPVPITPTTATGRSDLIIATIRDPDFAPWQPYTDPTQIKFGPYFYPEVISGVSSSAVAASSVVNYSALALARIDIPANTTNITSAMITDLRELAQPRYKPVYDVQGVGSTQTILTSDTTYKDWPSNSLTTKVPTWATHAQVVVSLTMQSNASSDANLRINFGGITGPNNRWSYNAPSYANDYADLPFFVFGEFDVRSLRNQNAIVKVQGQRVTGTSGGIRVTTQDRMAFDIQFAERAV